MTLTTESSYMKPRESEYTRAVDNWLSEHAITFTIERIGSSEGLVDEKRENGKPLLMHDAYRAKFLRDRAAFTKGGRTFDVPLYHQSAANSESQIARERCNCPMRLHAESCPKNPRKAKTPTAYDVLSCVTKSDPGTFADFCSDYGYDTDSRTAERTYFAVQEEWTRVRAFFTKKEIEQLQEIAS